MSRMLLLRRTAVVGGATVAALALGAGAASAHHCYIPMYSLNGPASPNWEVFTAEDGAAMSPEEGVPGYTAGCDEAVQAGYDALDAAGLPVGIKIKVSKTIGDPKDEGKMNPNGANGKGLEYFGAGSTLADEMVMTWIAGTQQVDCD